MELPSEIVHGQSGKLTLRSKQQSISETKQEHRLEQGGWFVVSLREHTGVLPNFDWGMGSSFTLDGRILNPENTQSMPSTDTSSTGLPAILRTAFSALGHVM